MEEEKNAYFFFSEVEEMYFTLLNIYSIPVSNQDLGKSCFRDRIESGFSY